VAVVATVQTQPVAQASAVKVLRAELDLTQTQPVVVAVQVQLVRLA
jgi:hypothetical protein